MNKQYYIMVVEDEEIEGNALAMVLRYRCRGIREVRVVGNGVSAIELAKECAPDIVLMDINLPGINGLETIRQMQQICGKTRFVIISAHSQFAYAQEALRLGVYDFLVKPVSAEGLRRVMGEVMRQIEHSRTQLEREKIHQEKLDAIRPVLESDCVFSIASMRSNTPLGVIFDFMQMEVNAGYVFLICGFGQGSTILHVVKSQMRGIGATCIGEIINGLCVFVALSEQPVLRGRVVDTMRYIADALHSRQLRCHMGVGNMAISADGLRKSYDQGVAAVRYAAAHGERMVFHDEMPDSCDSRVININDPAARICKYLRAGDCGRMEEELRRFFVGLQLSGEPEFQMLDRARWLYAVVYGSFPELAASTPLLPTEKVMACRDLQMLCDMLAAVFIEMSNQIKEQDNSAQSNQTITAVIQIVSQRYMENLSLETIASELNFSVFYLSKLFKRQTGETFTEYLTKYRIEKAKSFLAEGKMSVKEIAFATGYNSQGYFSKIFRKYTGVSPTEYRQ